MSTIWVSNLMSFLSSYELCFIQVMNGLWEKVFILGHVQTDSETMQEELLETWGIMKNPLEEDQPWSIMKHAG